jgi:hypothetical protein
VHFEILVEDRSSARALEILIPKILADQHSFRINSYKGIGHIPKSMKDATDPSKRILLTNLPKLLKGFGRTFQAYPPEFPAAVILVCDLDDKDHTTFLRELQNVLSSCSPKPVTRFCLAIEEGEAWFLGDLNAVRAAYPNAKGGVLDAYVNDSICGTWETLADAVYPGGHKALSQKGWYAVGTEKTRWSEKITPQMDVEHNRSPSFRSFRDSVRSLYG